MTATAPLTSREAVLLVGRTGNEFRERERAQLLALARIADHVWGRLDPGAASASSAARRPVGARAVATVQWETPTPPLVSAP